MTLTKTVRITGCSKEMGAYTFADLFEPEKIGQHPNHPEQYCYETPLERTVKLEVKPTGKVINDDEHTKHAEVLIYCSATDCPLHK